MSTLTISPAKDTFLNEYAPQQPYGDNVALAISDAPSGCYRPLLEFSLAGLPAGATINSASLQLYYYTYNPTYTDPVGKTVWAYKLTRTDWVEAEATWLYRYGTTLWTLAGGDYLGQERQVYSNTTIALSSQPFPRGGQRKTVSNQVITGVAFLLYKVGSPSGNVTFTIRKVSDDSVINSKVWGDASALPTSQTWEKAMFDSPVNINEEVRIQCEFSGGDFNNYVGLRNQNTDVKAGEYESHWSTWQGGYINDTTYDCAYQYLYTADGANTVFPASYGWMSWNVLALVQVAFNAGLPAEFLVRFELEGLPSGYTFSATFCSKEYTDDTTLRPKLVIDYTPPAGGACYGYVIG